MKSCKNYWLRNISDIKRIEEIKAHHALNDPENVEAFLKIFSTATVENKKLMLKELKQDPNATE
ncbi:hypothetical protein ABXJ76_02410 [Methylobacter sp. G7]|uniref:hypothetical protein n=1 Tax=Methylobacter sp. G7 TaxID=3230117 RepID=UPI003D809137